MVYFNLFLNYDQIKDIPVHLNIIFIFQGKSAKQMFLKRLL